MFPRCVRIGGVRWWILVCLLAWSGPVAAERLVIMEPPMVRKCPKGKTWNIVSACLAKHGTLKVVRQHTGAKLVSLAQTPNRRGLYPGLLLYVERRGEWHVAGNFEQYGEYQVLGFERQVVGKHAGWRIDIGQIAPTVLLVDDISPLTAFVRTKRSLYCSGLSYDCADATKSCEIIANGKTWYAFHGTFDIVPAQAMINVTGDRTKAGLMCQVQPRIYLGWPSNP